MALEKIAALFDLAPVGAREVAQECSTSATRFQDAAGGFEKIYHVLHHPFGGIDDIGGV